MYSVNYVAFEEGSALEVIGRYAFCEYQLLRSVNFENVSRLKRIEDDAFCNCSLLDVEIPKCVEFIGIGAQMCLFKRPVHISHEPELS